MNGLNKQGGVDFEIIHETQDKKYLAMEEVYMEVTTGFYDNMHCYNDFICT